MDQDIIQQTLFTEDFNMKGKRLVVNIVSIMIMVFISLLIAIIFVPMSYLARPTEVNRRNIVGLYAEKENSLDVVYVGGSAAFVYWEPLRAYNAYGFTSYNFGVNSVTPQSIEYLIKEAQKRQSPKLWIIDVRAFQYGEDRMFSEVPIRNATDALNYSTNRNDLIRASVKNKMSRIKYYLDFFKYKSRLPGVFLDSIINKDFSFLNFIDNENKNSLKGFYFVPKTESLNFVDYSLVIDELMIDKKVNKLYIDLLEFCKEEEIKPLFVVHSYIQQEDHKKEYNYMKRVAEEYGFDFLNTNDYYNEIDLDYSFELYNENHVNCFGAEKYTDFLASYLKNNYELPDHRADVNYKEWSDLYPGFIEETNATKTEILRLRDENNQNANN